jgi:hypothetical protein
MKKIIYLFVIAAIALACNTGQQQTQDAETDVQEEVVMEQNTLTQEEIDEGWVLLFDGKTTDKWRGYGKEEFPQGWVIDGDAIHVIGSGRGEAGHGGDIITKDKYGNFELELEWKVDTGGNSGIFYLAQEIDGQPIWKSSPEMQILDNFHHPDAKLGIEKHGIGICCRQLISLDNEVDQKQRE